MRRIMLFCAVAVAVGAELALPGVSGAQTPTQDLATGAGRTNLFENFAFSARSGPQGENPSGTLSLTFDSIHVEGDVVCLVVVGNRATLGVLPDPGAFPLPSLVTVVDNGAAGSGQDTFAALAVVGGPLDCSAPTDNLIGNVTPGDIVVTDAPPSPTSTKQCKNGGWRNFPGFENQGECVSFVATKGKNPPASSP